MIVSIARSIITDPKFLDAEILPDEKSIDSDAREVILKVIELSMLTLDDEPADELFAHIQTKLIAAGFLCSHFKIHEPLKLRVMMTMQLESSFVSGPKAVIDIVEGKVRIDAALNDQIQTFVNTRVPRNLHDN